MEWSSLGYKEFPFSVSPISRQTIDLFTGYQQELAVCQSVLSDKNVRLVIEGARGIGTTSFANNLKCYARAEGGYFAPQDEISVEKNWNLESLLVAVISCIVREMELSHGKKVKKNKVFIDAKALTHRLSEAYSSYGVNAFAVGGSIGKSSSVTLPTVIPSTTLGHHLKDLAQLVTELGYSKGVLIQFNNLDLNIVHTEDHLKYLFNAARDYFQIDNISWLLVGDEGLRSFISRKVDRLDDIISYDVVIAPLTKAVFHELIQKRLDCYKVSGASRFPVDEDVFDYLYDVTEGRLRYIFGLIYMLIKTLHVGQIIQQVTLDLAKTTIKSHAQERLTRFNLAGQEERVIRYLVKNGKTTVTDLSNETAINRTYVSKVLTRLFEYKLVTVHQVGTNRYYEPSVDAKIAYAQEDKEAELV